MLHIPSRASAFLILGLGLIACANAPGSDVGTNDSQVKAAKKPNTEAQRQDAGSALGMTPTKSSKSLPSAAACSKKATHSECAHCCEGEEYENLKASREAFDKCGCTSAKSSCSAECAAPYCTARSGAIMASEGSSDGPCASCQVDYEGCDLDAEKACATDELCAAATRCYVDSQCDEKPNGPDESSSEASSSP